MRVRRPIRVVAGVVTGPRAARGCRVAAATDETLAAREVTGTRAVAGSAGTRTFSFRFEFPRGEFSFSFLEESESRRGETDAYLR